MPLPEKIETLRLPLRSETAELSVDAPAGHPNHIIVPAQVLTRVRAEELIRRWAEVLPRTRWGSCCCRRKSCADPLVYVRADGYHRLGARLRQRTKARRAWCVSIRQPGGAIAMTAARRGQGRSSLTINGTVLLGRR